MSRHTKIGGVIGFMVSIVGAAPAFGAVHLMQIEQVIGGVNGDTTAQAIQLRMRSAGQNFTSGSRIVAFDAAGNNPIIILTLPGNVSNGASGARVLICSSGFTAMTSPTAVCNFTMTSLIPASYLAAGSVVFEADGFGILWRLSWGGASYTGMGTGSTINDSDGNFNPPFAGALSSTSLQALRFNGTAGALSTNNAAQYSVTTGAAVFTNNAGTNYTVTGPTGACCDDSTGVCMNGVTQATCEGGGDRYGSDGSTCATINPPCVAPPTGACCDEATGLCTENVTDAACPGRWGGAGSTCATIVPLCTGACCDDATGECVENQTDAQCMDRWGGSGSNCADITPPCPTGACCDDLTGICSEDRSRADCENDGFRYGGDDSTCATIDPLCLATCGNGVIEPTLEECDPNAVPNGCVLPSVCCAIGDVRPECVGVQPCACAPFCGNDNIEAGEECDPPGALVCPGGEACLPDCTCPPPLPNDIVWDPAKMSCTNSGADPTKACAVAADCGLCTLKKCSGLPANSTCTGSGTTGTCPLKQCSGLPLTTCTGTGQGSCPAGQTCDFTGQTCDFVNCDTPADCTDVSAGTCTAGPPGVCLAWPNNNPAATTRSLRFTVEGPAGPSKLEAIKVTMVDLQHPKPANLPTQAPTNMTTYDTKLNSTCAGATASPNYNGHHCDVTADCDIATGTAANDGTCTGQVACTADPPCTDPLDCTLPSNSCSRWVGKPGTFYEAQGPPQSGPYRAARLQCTPYYFDWKPEGLITVVGGDIAPSSEYSVEVYGTSCIGAEDGCIAVSSPVTMYTRRSGDVEVPFNPPSSEGQPNVTDIAQLVNKVKSLPGAPVKAISQLQPNLPEMNTNINVSDIVAVVDAVKLFKYAYSGPCPCPSLSACNALGCATDTACRNNLVLPGLGAGALCVKTCTGPGPLTGEPCLDNTHCVGSGTCGAGFCRDRCGRCSP